MSTAPAAAAAHVHLQSGGARPEIIAEVASSLADMLYASDKLVDAKEALQVRCCHTRLLATACSLPLSSLSQPSVLACGIVLVFTIAVYCIAGPHVASLTAAAAVHLSPGCPGCC